MPVRHCDFTNEEAFLKDIKQATYADKLIVIDFTATWCPPCQRIKPLFEGLSGKYPNVAFFKIDVDECEELCGRLQISAMPTFQFWKNGKKIDSFTGADEKKLEQLILKHK